MSDLINHECGIALIRLKKPYQYFIDKYNSPLYAIRKLYLLMEKQHNRGQDGAGVANIKLDMPPGKNYITRLRSVETNAIVHIFAKIEKKISKALEGNRDKYQDANWLKSNVDYTGELWLGHLRYGTHGENTIEKCHPMIRSNNWRSRNLVMAGNFNMTNVDQLFDKLVDLGQHPFEKTDTVTVMEKIGHFLDEEAQRQFLRFKELYSNREMSDLIESEIDLQRVLHRSCRDFDGGYLMAGMTGYGAAFATRDPKGIRPGYYFENDEIVVVASEKPAIKTAFDVEYSQIKEIEPGHSLIISKEGEVSHVATQVQGSKTSCSFERIYFSRGTDPEIYRERKQLGRLLTQQVLEEVEFDLENTVFSYIPNTAETAFLGLIEGIEDHLNQYRARQIFEQNPSVEGIIKSLSFKPRVEKLVSKDVKLRTFITKDEDRDDMVSHVYDTTYEVVNKGLDTLVVLDDSIVRGTTLERSILTMLGRLKPKKIIVVSSAPQIRYPDCYGIDMSRMKDFVAFRALIDLLKQSGKENLIEEVYEQCKQAQQNNSDDQENFVARLYNQFTYRQISDRVASIVTPTGFEPEVAVIYQTIESLHQAIPNHLGDWYFTGNYPTPGGFKVVNQAFINFVENKTVRAY
jgi:amidophosphoribosyltransferase